MSRIRTTVSTMNGLLPLAPLFVLFVFASGCSAPEPATTERMPAEEPANPMTAQTADESTAPVSDEAGEVSIEPPSDAPASDLPPVSEVNTEQLAEIVNATVGKVTVLNIWATWCPPCVHETPDLVKFYNETNRDDVALISLSIDDVPEISGAIPEFQREHEVSFPIYVMNERNNEGMNDALRGAFEGIVPTTYIYDRDGKLVETILGAVTLAALHEKTKMLLAPPDAA